MEGVRTPLGTVFELYQNEDLRFYTFQQFASQEWFPRAYGMHLWEIHSDTQEVLATACSAINLGMELQGCPRIMNHASVSVIKKSKRNSCCAPVESKWATQTWMLVAMMEFW